MVLQICRKENLKLNRQNGHFRCPSEPFFGKIISRYSINWTPVIASTEGGVASKDKEIPKIILGILSYLCKFLAETKVCEPF